MHSCMAACRGRVCRAEGKKQFWRARIAFAANDLSPNQVEGAGSSKTPMPDGRKIASFKDHMTSLPRCLVLLVATSKDSRPGRPCGNQANIKSILNVPQHPGLRWFITGDLGAPFLPGFD